MNSNTERFLTFASNRAIREDGFWYYFTPDAIEFIPCASEVNLTISFDTGELTVKYTQEDDDGTTLTDTKKTFPQDVRLGEIIDWLKNSIID